MYKNIFDLFDDLDNTFFPSFYSARKELFSIPRFRKEGSNLTLSLEVPGYGPEDVDVQVHENQLNISWDKNKFNITIPKDVVIEELSATVKNGLLTVTVPQKEAKQLESRKIKVLGQ